MSMSEILCSIKKQNLTSLLRFTCRTINQKKLSSSRSLSARLLVQKEDYQNKTTKDSDQVNDKFKEIQKKLKKLEPLVENEIKSSKALLIEKEEENAEIGSVKAKLGNSTQVIELYGTPDASQPFSSVPCSGCGAKLHCKDPSIPGYLASQIFLSVPLINQICQRCQLLKSKKVALDLKISANDYNSITREIKRHQALIVLLVDMTDPSNSFHSSFKQLLNSKRPMFVIGNKVDLIPKDEDGYLNHLRNTLIFIADQHGFNKANNVVHFDIVSAKTGFRLENLISKMLKFWKLKGNVFIVGCTNSGKSTLYNALLASDFCRSSATEVLSRATTSTWPGTTLNLLKFPIVNPKPTKLKEREDRLKRTSGERDMESMLLKSMQNRDTPNWHSLLGTTFLSPTQEALVQQHTDVVVPSYSFETVHGEEQLASHIGLQGAKEYLELKVKKYEDSTFKFWCYDTPGLINNQQIVNSLSAEELALTTVTNKQLQPTTIILRPQESVFVSGLSRIDYVEGRSFINLSIYTSSRLPIVTVPTSQAQSFYQEHVNTAKLGVPLRAFKPTDNEATQPLNETEEMKDPDRKESAIEDLTCLEGRKVEVVGRGMKQAAADLVLSNIGWASVSAQLNHQVHLVASTPQARGLCFRETPLVRYPHKNTGRRIHGTNRYKYEKVELARKDDFQ